MYLIFGSTGQIRLFSSEFGALPRSDLVAVTRDVTDSNLDVLIACAFDYDAHATEAISPIRSPGLKTAGLR